MEMNVGLSFLLFFSILLAIAGIVLAPSGYRYRKIKRFLIHELAGKPCSVCGVKYGTKIKIYRQCYDDWVPRKERTYEHWLFSCPNCQANVWVHEKGQIVSVVSKEEKDRRWKEFQKWFEEMKKQGKEVDYREIVDRLHGIGS